MKVKISTYKLIRELDNDKEYEFPEETSYYFETGIRRSVRMVPIWSTWKHENNEPEIIVLYHVTVIYLCNKNKVESFKISATSGLSELYNSKDERFRSEQASIIKSLCNGLFDKRTKEQFEADLNTIIHNLNDF